MQFWIEIGNNTDLEADKVVTTAAGTDLASKLCILIVDTSTKTGDNVLVRVRVIKPLVLVHQFQ